MLAGVRQIAYGLAMVMASFLVVMVAYATLWGAFLRSNALLVLDGPTPFHDPAYNTPGDARSLISLAVVTWLIGYAIRQVAKLMSPGRPA
jgi:hypothetical protein